MALSCFDALISLPIGLFGLILDAEPDDMAPWPGWKVVHETTSEIITTSAEEFHTFAHHTAFYVWIVWIYVIYGAVFFALFGFTGDMRLRYKAFFTAGSRLVFGYEPRSKGTSSIIRFSPPTSAPKSYVTLLVGNSKV